jgi:hypothetical protein
MKISMCNFFRRGILLFMRSKKLLLAGLLSFSWLFGISGVAHAQSQVSADPGVVLEIAKGYGSASLGKDNDGDPKVTGTMEGVKYTILFYGCNAGRNCKSITFVAYWKNFSTLTLEKVNRYNRDRRFGRAYIDKDGDLTLDMDVELEYRMSRRNLEEAFADWKLSLKNIKRDFEV